MANQVIFSTSIRNNQNPCPLIGYPLQSTFPSNKSIFNIYIFILKKYMDRTAY